MAKKKENDTVWMIQIGNINADSAPFFLEFLEGFSESSTCFEDEKTKTWTIQLYNREKPKNNEVEEKLAIISKAFNVDKPDFTIEKVFNNNWVAQSQKNFKPIDIGKFYISPTWHESEEQNAKISIKIDPQMAFGTGDHHTTKGCLKAIEQLSEKHNFKNCLDMGTGTGILAIAIAKLLPESNIVAIDIEEIAVETTIENAALNGVEKQITAECNDGYNSDIVIKNKPYDLIVSNILAAPLIEYSKNLAENLKKDGLVVLSGFYEEDSNKVFSAFESLGFKKLDEIINEGWSTLVLSGS